MKRGLLAEGVRRTPGGTGERVAREPLTGRVTRYWFQVVGSGPVGERATPTGFAVRGPYPWDRTRRPVSNNEAPEHSAPALHQLRVVRVIERL
jgi:hypothetical protein